jgi:hypothetical protein
MTKEAKQRDDALQSMSWAMGTLKTAISTLNIGEPWEGCEDANQGARETARQQIARLRKNIEILESLL